VADALVNVALLQMTPNASWQVNLQKAESFCRQAAEQGADVALMPEMFAIGYEYFFRCSASICPWPERRPISKYALLRYHFAS